MPKLLVIVAIFVYSKYMITDATSWKSTQLMKNRSYEINFYRDKDFKTVSMHSHDFYELYFFIGGAAGYIIENDRYRLMPGDILLISPSNLHQLNISDSSKDYERIVLWLSPRYLSRLSGAGADLRECFGLSSDSRNHLIRNAALSSAVKKELLALYSADPNEFAHEIAAEIHIKSALLMICRHVLSQSAGNTERFVPEHGSRTVTAALDYINSHLHEEISLDKLAQRLFISKYYLSHIFRKETDTTPYQYIMKKRLILSKRLIETGLAITEVSARCGFSDYTNFFRAFKREYGITPKQYYFLATR